MSHYKTLFDKEHLGSHDLFKDGDYTTIVLTIKQVSRKKVKTKENPEGKLTAVCDFVENVKPMILNIGNSDSVAAVAKTPDYTKWEVLGLKSL